MADESQSYFSAARKDTTLDELKLLQRQLLAGSPSRGVILNRPNVIIPQTGAAPYLYVDPRVPNAVPPDELQKRLQLLPENSPLLLMKRKAPPRLAGERDDLLRDIDNAIYGQPVPTPTPTPQTKYFPVSYFA
jgi:hypothetical protein